MVDNSKPASGLSKEDVLEIIRKRGVLDRGAIVEEIRKRKKESADVVEGEKLAEDVEPVQRSNENEEDGS